MQIQIAEIRTEVKIQFKEVFAGVKRLKTIMIVSRLQSRQTPQEYEQPYLTGPAQCLVNGGPRLANKPPKPEEIITQLRQVEVLMGQGQMCVARNG